MQSFIPGRGRFAGLADMRDSISAASADSSDILKDSLAYKADTIPTRLDSIVTARDSIHPLADSLMPSDTLWAIDSIVTAELEFQRWFNSLSKKERKKYIYEQELPAKMAAALRKLEIKDSLKAAKDSVIAATPRILETYALPDSMQYKRIVTWQHDRYFNNLKINGLDTSYNYHFNDRPFLKEDVNGTHLGVTGSPVQTYNFFKRTEEENVIFYTPYQSYSYSAETLPLYNTKTPYTELAYWGTLFATREKEESNIKILTTQNILPEWNVTLEYRRFGGKGMLKREDVDNRTFVASTNYMGKRYLMHAGYIYNKIDKSENGGITDNFWIRDTTVEVREIDVHLSEASALTKKNTVFLDQSYRIPFNFIDNIARRKEEKALQARRDSILASGDSTAIAALNAEMAAEAGEEDDEVPADTLNRNITTGFIGHSSEYSVFTRYYEDNIGASDEAGRNFYNNNFYINPLASADSMRVMRLENRVYLRLQPWTDDGIVSRIDAGIGHKLLNYYNAAPDSYLYKNRNTVQNSLYAYAGVNGGYKKYLSWDAMGRYTFLGHEINDFSVSANLALSFYPFRKNRQSPLMLKAHFETSLDEPDHYQQQFYSNHYKWDNSFSKISTTKVEAGLHIPHWKLHAMFGYSLLGNNIYYDTQGIVRQNTRPMSVITAGLKKDFRLWMLHFDHNLLFQISSDQNVLPLPMLATDFRYYIQFDVVKNVMQMQIGADARYNTLWYAPAYNPVLGVFHNQDEERYGNAPYLDLFINIQWKRACIFIKAENLSMNWAKKSRDYFSAHHYINTPTAFKVGIFWPFYIQPNRNSSVGGGGGGGVQPNSMQ